MTTDYAPSHPTLYLVRHGQASFGAADYDRLSELGAEQCRALGRWFAGRGVRFGAVLRGSLRRHEQSLAAIVEGAADAASVWPAPQVRPQLDEYDSLALVRTVHDGELVAPASRQAYREHFRLLRLGLARWMAGETAPAGMRSWREFEGGVAAVLDDLRTRCHGDVLLVSSGGPIATAVGLVLGLAPPAVVDLNLRMRNSAVTEFASTPRRHVLVAYNHLQHLEAEPRRTDWHTHA